MVYNDKLYIFGGFSLKCLAYCEDLWYWDFSLSDAIQNKWTYVNASAETRWKHTSFVSTDNSLYIVMGHKQRMFCKPMNEKNVFFDNQNVRLHSNVVFFFITCTYVFLKISGEFLNDIMKLDLTTYQWTYITSNSSIMPETRAGHAMTVDVNTMTGYVHGGYRSSNNYSNFLNETYVFYTHFYKCFIFIHFIA